MPIIRPNTVDGLLIRKKQSLNPATVPMGTNFVVVNIPGGQSLQPVSINHADAIGIIAAPVTIGVHSLAMVASAATVISPENLANVRATIVHTPLLSGTRQIYALFQCESTMVTGDFFNNTDKRFQISFVLQVAGAPTSTVFEACPIADIEGKTINFEYLTRQSREDADNDIITPIFFEPILGATGPKGDTGDTGPQGPPGSAVGIGIDEHPALRQLIHFIDEGPGDGFVSGAFKEIIGQPFPTSSTWYVNATKTQKIVEKIITYSGTVFPQTIAWNMYDVNGITVLHTVVDTIIYQDNIFESTRTRTIS